MRTMGATVVRVGLFVGLASCNGKTDGAQVTGAGATGSVPTRPTATSVPTGGATAAGGATSAGSGGSAGGAASTTSSGGSIGVAGSSGVGSSGTPQTVDVGGAAVVRMPPLGVKIVPGPTPQVPQSEAALDISGYPEAKFPSSRLNAGCSTCASDEWCYQNDRRQPYGALCSSPSANPLTHQAPPSVCVQRPTVCNDDCPIVCGCDGLLYCSACIANAWGQDRTWGGVGSCKGAPKP